MRAQILVMFKLRRIELRFFFFDYMSVYNNGLAWICEIHPVIDKDMVKILTGLDSTTCKDKAKNRDCQGSFYATFASVQVRPHVDHSRNCLFIWISNFRVFSIAPLRGFPTHFRYDLNLRSQDGQWLSLIFIWAVTSSWTCVGQWRNHSLRVWIFRICECCT